MKNSRQNRTSLALAGISGSLIIASAANAQFTVNPTSTDALDIDQGTFVTNFTVGIGPAPEPGFSLNGGGPEPGTCFFPDVGIGNAGFIEISTNSIALSSVRLYAKNDGIAAGFRRGMEGFRILADTDNNGSYETPVVDARINPDYDNEPNNLATQSEYLELELTFATVTSSQWRAEFVQGAQIGTFEGIRLIEVDGFADASCYADCDTSTGVGVLDIFDFLCFQDSFVAGNTYACDCDTSTGVGVCDIFDFLCFQDAFVAGCP